MSIEVAICHDYGPFRLDVNFAADRGITALFGPSGAGKTSVVNAVAGLLRPRRGRIAIDGHLVFDSRHGVFESPAQRRVGYVFQDARLFPHMTVDSNLRFGWRRARVRTGESEIGRVIGLLGLTHLLHRKPRNLSGGEKSRVALGRALLSSPHILLLDEPLAALDPARKAEIFPYLERLRDEAGIPMLYVSHSLEEVSRLADNLVVLNAGRIAASGTVFDILTDLKLPDFAGTAPFGTLIEARVESHRISDGLSVLAFAGGTLLLSHLTQPEGTRLRVRIPAEDVMIAMERPQAISANNVVPATVGDIRLMDFHADVRLICGSTAFVARITRASLARLSLEAGMQVFAIIKSVTVAPYVSFPDG